MFPIVKKRVLNETVTLMEIEAPLVARKALPGQFIIFRIDEEGERIPLTIAGYDREKGTVTIIFQKVGYTTMKLDTLNEGDALLDFVGPLGEPSHTEGVKRAAVIGGGLGVAIAYPQAKALHEAGCEVDLIVGFRNEHLPSGGTCGAFPSPAALPGGTCGCGKLLPPSPPDAHQSPVRPRTRISSRRQPSRGSRRTCPCHQS